jgi:hypothetical protein
MGDGTQAQPGSGGHKEEENSAKLAQLCLGGHTPSLHLCLSPATLHPL